MRQSNVTGGAFTDCHTRFLPNHSAATQKTAVFIDYHFSVIIITITSKIIAWVDRLCLWLPTEESSSINLWVYFNMKSIFWRREVKRGAIMVCGFGKFFSFCPKRGYLFGGQVQSMCCVKFRVVWSQAAPGSLAIHLLVRNSSQGPTCRTPPSASPYS